MTKYPGPIERKQTDPPPPNSSPPIILHDQRLSEVCLTLGLILQIAFTMAGEEEPRSLVVQGLNADITEETLELFFENTKRSGGGDIVRITLDPNTGSATILFEEADGIMTICFNLS